MAKAKTLKRLAVKPVDANSEEDNFIDNDESDVDNALHMEATDSDDNDDGYEDESEDDIKEFLEEDSKKRKHEVDDSEERIPKKRKNNKKNVKPPTAEEMLALRETENLFKSNLFRLQIEEMLSELKPKKSIKKYIDPWIDELKQTLNNLNESDAFDLADMKWMNSLNIQIPLKHKSVEDEKGVFAFKPPIEVFPIGSHSLACPLGPSFSIDLAIVMPKTFLLRNDNLNQRYHLKRALYICYIAGHLKNSSLLSSDKNLQFKFMNDDPRKPILVLCPSGKLSKFITVNLHAIPEENSFKFKRLLPSKNNVRPQWWGIMKDILPPTPIYNSSILEDLVLKQNHLVKKEVFEQNQSLRDAFILLRVWLKQRGLNEGFGSFSSHLLSMLLVYLLKINKINKHMSSYQIIRHVWLYLGDCDWTEEGVSLCEVKQEGAPSLEEFHLYNEVVFVDVTGYSNIASCLNKFIFKKVKEESKLAIKHLDDQSTNGFVALFMAKMPFIRQFDVTMCFKGYAQVAKVVESKGDEVNAMDYTDFIEPEFVRLVTELMEKGIGHRLTSTGVQLKSLGSWDVDSSAPILSDIKIGLNLNIATALSLIDKGPEPNEHGAEDFREFWGSKCELRRFKDGTICESVVWKEKSSTVERRRSITNTIVLYLLKEKLDISFCNLLPISFQNVIVPQIRKWRFFTREETCKKILLAYEDLSRQLRDLPDLPLSIVSVHCISPAYRFTELFPPLKVPFIRNIEPIVEDPVKGRLFPDDGKLQRKTPHYISPIDCVVQMALTKKWPDDLNAGKRLIAAFNIAITAALKKHYNLSCQITTDYFVVNKDGFLFRLYLGYSKEIGLLKLKISEEGVRQYRDTPESLALEKKFINLPKITGAIYRLSEEYPGFSSATCLAKRWFSSQLLDETHFPTVLIEMIMGYIFINPQPYTQCLSVLPAFLRFLTFLSTTDWATTPVIVNFNSILTRDEIKDMEEAFRDDRSAFPPLFLATPYDKTGSLWSKSVPTLSTLLRLTKLAAASLQIIETNIIDRSTAEKIIKVFQPPMAVYDIVIKLQKYFQFRKEEGLFTAANNFSNRKIIPDRNPSLPILGFNPVDLYLSELRENFSDFALFFHDSYGGLEIGVIFKPGFFEDVQFQTSMVNARKPVEVKNKVNLMAHLDSILDGFKILGNGIVKSIEWQRLKNTSTEAAICT